MVVGKKNIAIIVHIHYLDTINLFKKVLPRDFLEIADLYFTLTPDVIKNKDEINNMFPDSVIDSFDNKGRDILPFFESVEKNRINQKYDYVLKLHGKKTVALPGYGAFWLIDSVTKLIPSSFNDEDYNKLREYLDKGGIVGPSGQVFNYESSDKNHKHLLKLIKDSDISMEKRFTKYFFGGSMFWISTKELSGMTELVIKNKKNFDEEKGQFDGTIAHAIERLFTIYCTNKKQIQPYVMDFSQRLFREVNDNDLSVDGLIRTYEEFSSRAVLVSLNGEQYITNYKDLKDLQEKQYNDKLINSEKAVRLIEEPDNIHTLLIKTQEELSRIKSSKKYKMLEKVSRIKASLLGHKV